MNTFVSLCLLAFTFCQTTLDNETGFDNQAIVDPQNLECYFDTVIGHVPCNITLYVRNIKYGSTCTISVDRRKSYATCKRSIRVNNYPISSDNPPACRGLDFTVSLYSRRGGRASLRRATASLPTTITCPKQGFDIDSKINPCPPDQVEQGKCSENIACFKGPQSWEDCGKLFY